jgi:hypothetical protein
MPSITDYSANVNSFFQKNGKKMKLFEKRKAERADEQYRTRFAAHGL